MNQLNLFSERYNHVAYSSFVSYIWFVNMSNLDENIPSPIGSDFNKLWFGQTISLVGSQVTMLALPITAAVTLGATSIQMGILSALGSLPALLFGLLAGVWVDHHKRRMVLIGADIGRAVILSIIPLSALAGMMRLEVLYVVGFLAGTLGSFFNIAYRSYLPSLVTGGQLLRANSRLELSNSIAEIIGPGLAGGVVQLIGAPIAIVIDAFSFIISALSIGLIRVKEPELQCGDTSIHVGQEIRDGLRHVFGEARLRALAGCITSLSFFNAAFEAVQILYLTRQLGLSASWLGIIFAGGSVGLLLGAIIAERVNRRVGLGKSMLLAVLLTGGSDLLFPIAGRFQALWLVISLLILAQFFFGIGLTMFQIGQVSLRQSLTPDQLQGRMNATMSLLSWGIVPVGALLGGVLGEILGVRPILLLAALGEICAVFWLYFSPIRLIKQAIPV
jgi:MFS family permease